MGYNFWLKFVISKDQKNVFLEYINRNGTMDETGYIAKFEHDPLIEDYVYSYFPNDDIKKHLDINNRVAIGYFFYKECSNEAEPDKVAFSFMAATKYMSSLLRDSKSIYKWIIEISTITNSILTYLDFEHFGYRIIFHKGYEVYIDIKYDGEKDDYGSIPNFDVIMKDYFYFAKLYFLGQ